MAAAKDLVGQKFGHLTVLSLDSVPYLSPSGKQTRRWICRCDCGNELFVLQNALTGKNGTRSCGCARRVSTRQNGHNLKGKRFGRLVVIEEVELKKPESNGNRRGWLCRCDCGKEIVATQKRLELDGLKSCGCLLSDTAMDKILFQNTIGHYDGTTLSAIQLDRPPNKNNTSGVKGVYWSGREKCWIAKIGVKGKSVTIGRFTDLKDAEKARKEAEEKYFKPILDGYDAEK